MGIASRLFPPVDSADDLAWSAPGLQAPETLTVTSTDVVDGRPLPDRFQARVRGRNAGPSLHWSGAPADARELVVVVEDPDIPRRGVALHGGLAGLVPSGAGIAAGPWAETPGAASARLVLGKRGFVGALPPKGHPAHRYVFQVFALSEPSGLADGFTRAQALEALSGKVVARGRLTTTFER